MDEPLEPGPGGGEVAIPEPEPEVPVTPTPPVVPDPESPAVPAPLPEPQIVPAANNTVVEAAAAPEAMTPRNQNLAVTGGSDFAFWGATAAGLIAASTVLLLFVRRDRARRIATEKNSKEDNTDPEDSRS
jgi:hypothetical protein